MEIDIVFTKVINYSCNLILNTDNQIKINEFIEIQETQGQKLTAITVSIIQALCKFRTNAQQLLQDIQILHLDKDKKELLREKLVSNMQQLRKFLFHKQLKDVSTFKDLQWRLQVETASRGCKQSFKPNVFLNFQMEENGQIQDNFMNCDYANLKKLTTSLNEALSLHRSNRFKAARNSSV